MIKIDFKRILAFLRLLDENGDISITNLFALVTLWKFWQMDKVSLEEMGALLLIIGGYQFKRYIQRKNK